MKNSVMTASGTAGYGRKYNEFCEISNLGAFVPKTVTLHPRKGNPPPRIVETPAGMLNSIGLQNPGINKFLEEEIPSLSKYGTPIIVNISATNIADFVEITKRIASHKNSEYVNGIEVNISCPNVEGEGMAFGTNEKATRDVIYAVKEVTDKTLIAKLTPNVTNIVKIAESAQEAGADALSMINTVLGMAIDIKTRKPMIHGNGRYMGGLSGPAIKPIGVRCVYQVHKSPSIHLPIIGIGGIRNGSDAIEYILAGATCIAVGTGNFVYLDAAIRTIKGIEKYMRENNVRNITDLIGRIEEI